MLDYYGILGVSSEADIVTIKKAYKARARECHPDRGGSHERMVSINEAWEVLSDPVLKSQYDQWRSSQKQNRHNAPSPDVSSARNKAQTYEKDWATFESWLDSLRDDVLQAKYGRSQFGMFGFESVTGSATGILSMMSGGALALVIGVLVISFSKPTPFYSNVPNRFQLGRPTTLKSALPQPSRVITYKTNLLWGENSGLPVGSPKFIHTPPKLRSMTYWYLTMLVCIGLGLGTKAHRIMANALALKDAKRSPVRENQGSAATDGPQAQPVVACPYCRQQLRLPGQANGRKVRCKRCGNSFAVG